ncbi:MAG: T9SS type A sorting domain-containing protein [Bacteroidia bacterium]|nr:T9SS type A sorting domain-containing protein [Bacteroidia bacterium]
MLNTNTIDISKLSGGIYILRAKTDKGIFTKKLIKE